MLHAKDVTLAYGAEPVLEGVNLEVRAGEFASLVGPSGSGKTSILRAATGLQQPRSGVVELDVGRDEIGFLFQDDALLPWRTARQNVALGLRIRNMAKNAALKEADDWLDKLGLSGFGGRFPRELSGGQRKRVAIAQILALKPRLLLMDEPFASLDAIVRAQITQDLLGWVEQEHMTVLLVTHDLEEALSVSDVVYVLSQGPRARIRSRYPVPIARPRDILQTRTDPAFAPLLGRLWHDLSEEVRPSARKAAE
ncbi:ABC transporter ATP-binding protein [Rhodospirillaceae bacterium SYSU D60014]|uniref:ABC transporter ATP-binding protein n=1 Tax=Virgifigura deserti TaxID=2268457 RepID=UPI000E6702FC